MTAVPDCAPAGAARRRAAICAAAAVASISVAAVAGCSASSHAAAGSTASTTATASASATVPTTAAATPTTAASTSPASAVPTLGQPTGDFARGQGFGQVKPSEIFNGGDPTGLVKNVVWQSWGGAQAQATGTSDYVGPNQTVAAGKEEPATVVAFDLGTCDGKLMYQAVEWYFPQHGQAFNPHQYENICTGAYVPSQ